LARSGAGIKRQRMFLITKRPGQRLSFRFMPGCLVMSLLLSLALTVAINVLIRLF
jgi:hypothetical protein